MIQQYSDSYGYRQRGLLGVWRKNKNNIKEIKCYLFCVVYCFFFQFVYKQGGGNLSTNIHVRVIWKKQGSQK